MVTSTSAVFGHELAGTALRFRVVELAVTSVRLADLPRLWDELTNVDGRVHASARCQGVQYLDECLLV